MKSITLKIECGIRGKKHPEGTVVKIGDPTVDAEVISEICAIGLVQSGRAEEVKSVSKKAES